MIPRRFFWLFDLLILCCAFAAAYWLVPSLGAFLQAGTRSTLLSDLLDVPSHWNGQMPPLSESLWILLVMALTALVVMGLSGSHGSLVKTSLTRIIVINVVAILTGLSMITLCMFAFKSPGWSRLLIFIFTVLSGVGLVTYRLLLRKYFMARRDAGYYHKNVLLIGLPSSIEWMVRYFKENIPPIDYRPFGYLCLYPDQLYQSNNGNGNGEGNGATPDLALLGNVGELGSLLIHQPIHEVITIHPVSGGEWIQQVIQDCDYFSMPLRIIPEALLLKERKSLKMLYHLDPLHLPAVVMMPPHNLDSEALFFKRLLDIAISAILLVLLAPLLALIAAAIKLTTPSLPIFYRWRVVGRNGVEFTGYKFTTMNPDADRVKVDLAQFNEMSGPVFKMKDDPRVTSLGKFLRKYSLNELPQLWSVLKGDMSLVGPRPAFRHELQRYEFWHKRKLSIQPGITCLWQVNGRNRISNFDDWVALDLEYIDNWSLWLDMKILLRTARTVIAGSGW
jgi:exopolysaccharide biosynthesis polyprenyl glycosylphosphotransferase